MDIALIGPSNDSTPTRPRAATTGTTVLVVDDAYSNRKLVAALLEHAGLCDRVLFAEDGLSAFKTLREDSVDLVVCDLDMPRCDGLKFLQLKATDAKLESIPVVLLTGAEDVSRKVQALQAGACDYVVKPFDGSELVARIGVHLKVRKLQRQLMAANDELVRVTLTDPLTNVANRRCLMQKLDEELARAQRYGRPLSVAIVDVDHFKRVNDDYGHQAGDAVLMNVARLLAEALRSHDLVARFGGEEFAILLPETSQTDAVRAVDRLREALQQNPTACGDAQIPVTASFGVASREQGRDTTATQLLGAADAALYLAKRSGRNRVCAAP